jgi:hypothetical protein
MRLLFTIPHFYRPRPPSTDGIEPIHGSEAALGEIRAGALLACVSALHQTFGKGQAHLSAPHRPCNELIASEIAVVLCTTRGHHLTERLPGHLFRHHETAAEPLYLGYECHAVLADNLGRFDYYCFLEDDLVLTDPLFFWKQRWFNGALGDRAVLQPHRFELAAEPPIQKLFIDGPIRDPTIAPRFQDKNVRPRIQARGLGMEIAFERVDNPHSGCFFLTEAQMARWTKAPYFLDRAKDFWGPLESAATLGVMRTFEVYKPALANAGFLEIHHLDNRYLGRLLRLPARNP